MAAPIRILTAVPLCDGHDSAINSINLEFIHHGIEVIYLGYHRSARDIVRAAIQEDVRAIGISSYNGGHVEFFSEVLALLKKEKAAHIAVFGGGGGTVSARDAAIMQRRGVERIFFAGTPLAELVQFVKERYTVLRKAAAAGLTNSDAAISARLARSSKITRSSRRPLVIGITGPGGAGKTTLIDELVLRFLKNHPQKRIAILSHDPSIVGKGALLGDRATMIYSQHDRVFMRSLATRGKSGGLAALSDHYLALLAAPPFDLVLVETVGIGQEALPFKRGVVNKTVLVMSPDYGSRLQLQKIAMLEAADIVVVNKSDLSGARTASSEIERLLTQRRTKHQVLATVANRHRDAGVDALYGRLLS